MSDKLKALTVAELKTLCTEMDINVPPRARKQEIIEAIISQGGEIREGLIVPVTPRKSMLTPRKSRRWVNKEETPRELRHRHRDDEKSEALDGDNTLAETPVKADPARRSSRRISKALSSEEELDSHRLTDSEIQADEQKNPESATEETFLVDSEVQAEGTQESSKIQSNSPDPSSESEEYFTPTKKNRKRWSRDISFKFEFARDDSHEKFLSERSDGNSEGSSGSTLDNEADEGTDSTFIVSDRAPVKTTKPETSEESEELQAPMMSLPVVSSEETFIVETPSKYVKLPKLGIMSASKPVFKASKTPNFKKIHERNQANMENIGEYSARKRERMRNLLTSSRQVRDAGNAARKSSGNTLKTPLKNIRDLATPKTPSSARKILSDKVRSNRRFELLMKARGIPVDEEPIDDFTD